VRTFFITSEAYKNRPGNKTNIFSLGVINHLKHLLIGETKRAEKAKKLGIKTRNHAELLGNRKSNNLHNMWQKEFRFMYLKPLEHFSTTTQCGYNQFTFMLFFFFYKFPAELYPQVSTKFALL